MTWSKFFIYLDVIVPFLILCLTLAVLRYRKARLTKVDVTLLFFLLIQVLLNGLANNLQNRHINNHWVYHFNSILTQSVFSVYFYLKFRERSKKILVLATYVIFLCFFAVNVFLFQRYDSFNSYSYALGAFFIVLYGLLSFYSWTEYIPTHNILTLKEFWASAGILFYFGSSFFIFISYRYLSVVSAGSVGILWRLHNVFLALGCLLFFKAITVKQWIK